MKSKKKVSGVLSDFEILILILDILELQLKKKIKKKVLKVLNGSFMSSHVGGGNSLFNFFKGGNLKKKVWETLLYSFTALDGGYS